MEERPKVEIDPSLVEQSSDGKDRAEARGTINGPSQRRTEGGQNRRPAPEPPVARQGRRRLWIPLWAGILALLTLIGALLLLLDLRNRDRYLLVCQDSAMELHRGRRFPLPFGHEAVGGDPYRPVAVSPRADCRPRVFASRAEAEQALLAFIMSRVRAELERKEGADLKQAHRQVLQALQLVRAAPRALAAVNRMLAEVSYREGRDSLVRIEGELRAATARFREAERLDGARYSDLKRWISHLELLLRSVAPAPGPLPADGLPGRPPPSSAGTKKDTNKPIDDAELKGRSGTDAGVPGEVPPTSQGDPGGILL